MNRHVLYAAIAGLMSLALSSPERARRREELAENAAGQGFLCHPAAIWTDQGVLRSELEAERYRKAVMRGQTPAHKRRRMSAVR